MARICIDIPNVGTRNAILWPADISYVLLEDFFLHPFCDGVVIGRSEPVRPRVVRTTLRGEDVHLVAEDATHVVVRFDDPARPWMRVSSSELTRHTVCIDDFLDVDLPHTLVDEDGRTYVQVHGAPTLRPTVAKVAPEVAPEVAQVAPEVAQVAPEVAPVPPEVAEVVPEEVTDVTDDATTDEEETPLYASDTPAFVEGDWGTVMLSSLAKGIVGVPLADAPRWLQAHVAKCRETDVLVIAVSPELFRVLGVPDDAHELATNRLRELLRLTKDVDVSKVYTRSGKFARLSVPRGPRYEWFVVLGTAAKDRLRYVSGTLTPETVDRRWETCPRDSGPTQLRRCDMANGQCTLHYRHTGSCYVVVPPGARRRARPGNLCDTMRKRTRRPTEQPTTDETTEQPEEPEQHEVRYLLPNPISHVNKRLVRYLKPERTGNGLLWDGQAEYRGVVMPAEWTPESGEPFPGFTVLTPGTTTPLHTGVRYSSVGGIVYRAAEKDPEIRTARAVRTWFDMVGKADDPEDVDEWIRRVDA